METSKGEKFFEVFPENWTAVCAFRLCQTQWNIVAGVNGAMYSGFRYEGVRAMIDTLGMDDKAGLMLDLHTMERAALSEFDAIRREKAAGR
jgi:hypothetical protein